MRHAAALADLLLAAAGGTTRLVRDTHAVVASTTFDAIARVQPLRHPARAIHLVERAIAGIAYGAVGAAVSGASVALAAAVKATDPEPATSGATEPETPELAGRRAAAAGILNGAVGDELARRGNALAVEMTLRHRGRRLAIDAEALARTELVTRDRLCVFVHGLGCTERVWEPRRAGDDGEAGAARCEVSFGDLLERDLGHAPLYLRYNSGLPVAANARRLARLLAELHRALRDAQIVLLGHSMGGLVAQGAALAAREAGDGWGDALTHVICLGTPHHAAPLERAACRAGRFLGGLDLPGAVIPARLLAMRSAGVCDLGVHRRPATALAVHRLAGTVAADPVRPLSRLLGDGVVGVASALGNDETSARNAIVGDVSHLRLARHPAVYAQIRAWIAAGTAGAAARN